jgi:hypothetical protein
MKFRLLVHAEKQLLPTRNATSVKLNRKQAKWPFHLISRRIGPCFRAAPERRRSRCGDGPV